MSRDSILLVGQGHWAYSLAEGLKNAGLCVDVAGLDSVRQALSPVTWKAVAKAAVVVRIGFRPGAKTVRGIAFDAAMHWFTRRRALTCCYWIGTDVQNAGEDASDGVKVMAWRSPNSKSLHHLAGSEPLRRELAAAGITATVVPFPWRTVIVPPSLPPMPEAFTAMTYVPDTRSDFFGGPTLLEVARRLPEVQFQVMGGVGSWAIGVPPNVRFLGWVANPSDVYAESSCVIRLTAHDSIGGTAVEGLLFGRPVLYTQHFKWTQHVDRTADSVVSGIQRLLVDHKRGTLKPDTEAAAWARQEFDQARRFADLANHLSALRLDSPP